MSLVVHERDSQTLVSRQNLPHPNDVTVNRARSRTDGDVATAESHDDDAETSLRPSVTTRSHSSPATSSSSPWSSENPAHAVAGNLRLHGRSHADADGRRGSIQAADRVNTEELDIGQSQVMSRPNMDSSLPDDDGMQELRKKLQEIRLLSISTEDKAKRMHELMTLGYRSQQPSLGSQLPNGESPARSEGLEQEQNPLAPARDPENPYNIRPEDLQPQISPLSYATLESHDDHEDAVEDEIPSLLGCMHYKRNVKIQCFDCRRWFPCRHCHDAAQDLSFPHALNRQKTQNMLCMLCFTPQPAAEICTACLEYAAWYYCSKCKLWDNDSNKRIYHCDDCGICRVGEGLGKDFVHCRRCNVCINIAAAGSHPCIEGATEGDCPLCLVRLFESKTPVVSLPCGHYMHGDCYKDLMAVTYKCPVCSKSAVNMELQWRKLDDEIRAQPMPDDENALEGLLPFIEGVPGAQSSDAANSESTNDQPAARQGTARNRTVWIGCNDCSARCWTPFHWLGLKCQVCDSYNTIQMAPTAVQETEAERYLRQQQQHHHRQHDLTGDDVLRSADSTVPARNTVRFLEVPTSPSQVPTLPPTASNSRPHSPTSPQSPGGRYFVQPAPPRRPSFNLSTFSTQSLPTIPNLPSLPEGFTRMPRIPNLPNLPNLPNMPNLPNLPNMPNIDFPRFSAYNMFSAMSRSLSPMTYYLQSADTGDTETTRRHGNARKRSLRPGRMRDRHYSNASIRSEPAFSMSTGMASSSAVATSDDEETKSKVKSLQKRVRELLLAGNSGGQTHPKQNTPDPTITNGDSVVRDDDDDSDEHYDDDDDDFNDDDDDDDDEDEDEDDDDGYSTDDFDIMGHR